MLSRMTQRTVHITQVHSGSNVVTGRTVRTVTYVEPRTDLPNFAADIYFTDGTMLEHRDNCALAVTR